MKIKNFNIIEGNDDEYYDKYEDYIDYYNNSDLTVKQIMKILNLNTYKTKKYRERAIEEHRLKIIGYRGSRNRSNLK